LLVALCLIGQTYITDLDLSSSSEKTISFNSEALLAQGQKINLSSCLQTDLELINEIGATLAQNIIERRSKILKKCSTSKYFPNKDFPKIPGIGPKRLNHISEFLHFCPRAH
jgi:DNA uptake protein ComE-like DNA-binding protein